MALAKGADLMTGAVFSEDGLKRYALWRFWNYRAASEGIAKAVMFIMANPSVAGKYQDDPTIVKIAHFAQRWGYDGLYVGNLYSIIMTHWMADGYDESEAVGADNDMWLETMKNSSALHVAAWGFMGRYHPERAETVRAMFPEMYHLGISKDGQPKHPLYLPINVVPELWEG